jgi:hypothetical protein
MVKAAEIETIRSQAPKGGNTYGEGSTTKWWWAEAVYALA